jgi:purine-binding chemotaxis protein CheW
MSGAAGTPGAASWVEIARAAATGSGASASTRSLRQMLTFRLDSSPYAVPIERVREIVRVSAITPMPRVPRWLRGVLPLRGEMVEVVDLRLRLGMSASALSRESRIIVLHDAGGGASGLLVDGVNEVVRVAEEALREIGTHEDDRVSAMWERDGRFISLLDVDRVLGAGDER